MVWPAVRKAFPQLAKLPEHVLIQVGYPSSGARGASQKMKPAELNTQWTGNSSEEMLVLLHPVQLRGSTPREQALSAIKALSFSALKYVDGARWGATRAGLTKEDGGSVTCTVEAQKRIDAVIDDVGEPPAGYGMPFPTRQVNRTRMRRYVCSTKLCAADNDKPHPVHRVASDTDEFQCTKCGNPYVKA